MDITQQPTSVDGGFTNLPEDPDTKILFSQTGTIDQYHVLFQKWYWDGITGQSFIFLTDEVGGLKDEELKAVARSSPMVKPESNITISRDEVYTFTNFNFER